MDKKYWLFAGIIIFILLAFTIGTWYGRIGGFDDGLRTGISLCDSVGGLIN